MRERLTWWSPGVLATWLATEPRPWRAECCPAWCRGSPRCRPGSGPAPGPAPAWSCWRCWCCAGDCRPRPSPCWSGAAAGGGGGGSSRRWWSTSGGTPGAGSSPPGCWSLRLDLKQSALSTSASLTTGPHYGASLRGLTHLRG